MYTHVGGGGNEEVGVAGKVCIHLESSLRIKAELRACAASIRRKQYIQYGASIDKGVDVAGQLCSQLLVQHMVDLHAVSVLLQACIAYGHRWTPAMVTG